MNPITFPVGCCSSHNHHLSARVGVRAIRIPYLRTARSISRLASRSAIAWRLSY
jgi:hypothetical protein